MIDEFTNAELIDAAVAFVPCIPHNDPDRQTFEEACRRDPIALGRDIVRALRASGQRRELFDDIVKDGNEKGHFRVGENPSPVTLPQLQLLHDVRTRWDSVFFMIKRLRIMRPVSFHVCSTPTSLANLFFRLLTISLLSPQTKTS